MSMKLKLKPSILMKMLVEIAKVKLGPDQVTSDSQVNSRFGRIN